MVTQTRADAVQEIAERVMVFLSLSDWGKGSGLGKTVHPMTFNRVEPLLKSPLRDDPGSIIFTDATPQDLDTPLNIALLGTNQDCEEGFSAHRWRAAKPKDYRGKVRAVLPYMLDWAYACFWPNGKALSNRIIAGTRDFKTYHALDCETREPREASEWVSSRAPVVCGMQFARQYFWHISLAWEGCPAVLLPTDPAGAREVFRLRDIPEGKSRRAALRHWVTEHWRQRRSDPSEEVFVRECLRGAQEFHWNGLRCTIEPSKEDLRRETTARAKRASMPPAAIVRQRRAVKSEAPHG